MHTLSTEMWTTLLWRTRTAGTKSVKTNEKVTVIHSIIHKTEFSLDK